MQNKCFDMFVEWPFPVQTRWMYFDTILEQVAQSILWYHRLAKETPRHKRGSSSN